MSLGRWILWGDPRQWCVLAAALAVAMSVAELVPRGPLAEASVELRVGRGPGTYVYIEQVRVDGVLVGGDDLVLRGDWEVETRADGSAAFRTQAPGSSLLARAAEVRVMARTQHGGGMLEWIVDGRTVGNTYLERASTSLSSFSVPAPVGVAGWCLGAIVGALLLVFSRRCLDRSRGQSLAERLVQERSILLALLGTAHLVFWLSVDVGVSNDTPGYPAAAAAALRGTTGYFPPGYGFFLAPFGLGPLSIGPFATLAQHALVVVAVGWIFEWIARSLRSEIAFVVAFLLGVMPSQMGSAQALMTESLTMVAIVYVLRSGFERAVTSGRSAAAIGLAVAGATLLRVVPALALVPMLPFMRIAPGARRWRLVGCAVAAAILPVVVLVIHNGVRCGRYELTASTARHLFNHFVHEQRLLDEDGPWTRAVADSIEFEPGQDLRDLYHWEVARRSSSPFIEQALSRVVAESVRQASLLEHLRFDAELTWRNLVVDHRIHCMRGSSCNADLDTPMGRELVGAGWVGRGRSDDLWTWVWSWGAYASVWRGICIAFAAAILLVPLIEDRRDRQLWAASAWAAWSLLFWSSAVEYASSRYQIPIVPLVVAMAVTVPLLVLARWIPVLRQRVDPPPDSGDASSATHDIPVIV